jgi:hypothetical protein
MLPPLKAQTRLLRSATTYGASERVSILEFLLVLLVGAPNMGCKTRSVKRLSRIC